MILPTSVMPVKATCPSTDNTSVHCVTMNQLVTTLLNRLTTSQGVCDFAEIHRHMFMKYNTMFVKWAL